MPTSRLTVTKIQSISNGRGPQLVLCSIMPATGASYTAMAKIYDGLYYPFKDVLALGPQDVCRTADQDYSIEAVAYEELREIGLMGDFTPEFYGSYTFTLPLHHNGVDHIRPVRMILLEAIEGLSIKDLFLRNSPFPSDPPNGHHYSEEFRLTVIAKVMDGVVKQFNQGIQQYVLAPRNVVIVNPYAAHITIARVVLVDYNRAILFRWSKYGILDFQKQALPLNQMRYWWGSYLHDFQGWAPDSWYVSNKENQRCRQQWLKDAFGGDNACRYQAIGEELSDYPSDEGEGI